MFDVVRYTELIDRHKDHLFWIGHSCFCSVSYSLDRVSGLVRLVRVLKLGLIVFLPLIVSSHSTVSIALAVCQLLTAGLFWLKFTYQRMQM